MLLMYVHMCSLGSYCFYSVGVAFLHRGVISTLLIFQDLKIWTLISRQKMHIYVFLLVFYCLPVLNLLVPPSHPPSFNPIQTYNIRHRFVFLANKSEKKFISLFFSNYFMYYSLQVSLTKCIQHCYVLFCLCFKLICFRSLIVNSRRESEELDESVSQVTDLRLQTMS